MIKGAPPWEPMLQHFRDAFRGSPTEAYRDWFRLQEELRERGDEPASRALADDLWEALPGLSFPSREERGRFFHNAAVFFGSPGPSANLERAREAFGVALEHYPVHEETGWRARALHNFATALSNLAGEAEELAEAVRLFQEALAWRTEERPIARAVSLHNLGIALRRWSDLDGDHSAELLRRSEDALREAVDLRGQHRLAEGRSQSLLQLAATLQRIEESAGVPGGREETPEARTRNREETPEARTRKTAEADRKTTEGFR